jgi:hypothetical protein
MNSLFFIDPNNENANLCACAVGERRAQAPGTAIAELDPAPVSACYLQGSVLARSLIFLHFRARSFTFVRVLSR